MGVRESPATGQVAGSWLGVHAWLMSGVHQRVEAFLSWAWDFLGSSRSSALLDDPDAPQIDWNDETEDETRDAT